MVPRLSFYLFCFVLLLFLLLCSHLAAPQSSVKYLPGFQGPLPFQLETGYIGVGESEDVQLFYYFFRSENDPKEDPLMLWLTGGPGCSVISAIAFEIGPLYFKAVEYNGSIPTLVLNSNSWTKVASILFVDSPVGTGFSYARTHGASQSSDLKAAHHNSEFLRKWLNDHSEFLSNPIYLGGDSYSGITLPATFQQILDGNVAGMRPNFNLKGYLLGNPKTVPHVEGNSVIPFAHGMALISDELYASLRRNCREDYVNIDPRNKDCLQNVQDYEKCVDGINTNQILEPLCAFASPKPFMLFGKRRSLSSGELLNPLPQFGCRNYGFLLSHHWLNDNLVREALHIRKVSMGEWQRCNYGLSYTYDIASSFKYHVNFSSKGYRSLIYSGDHDMIIPFLGTEMWIRSLNYSIVDDWRPWKVDGQIGGYTRTYSNLMTYATVKGGGHTAPEYKPESCFAMFKRWISERPL